MIVRSFQLSDYVAITNLLEEVLSEQVPDHTMSAFARQLSWDSELVLVAQDEQEIVGVMIGTIDKNKGYYYRVAVHPGHRRKGIAKSLIQTMRERFVKRGVYQILVTLDEYNESVFPVFQSAGCCPEDISRSFQKLSILTGA